MTIIKMKEVQLIDFEKIKEEILEIFPSAYLDDWDLIPDLIHRLAATQGIDLIWREVPNWTDFEAGRIDFSEDEFLEFAFYRNKPKGQVFMVTDNCFKNRKAYGLNSGYLLDFVSNIDEIDGEISFVQPSDYVFVNPEQKLVTLIHHEGQVTQYRRWF